MFWTPQSDDAMAGDYDEVTANLRADMGEVQGDECPWCGGEVQGDECPWCGADLDPEDDGEDGYASGGHMDYWHAQYE